MKNEILIIGILYAITQTSVCAYGKEAGLVLPPGVMETPYEACKNIIVVAKDKYNENAEKWKNVEVQCHKKVQVAEDVGITTLTSLNEGVKYLNVATKVAEKILANLKKSHKYAECSSACFNGSKTCNANESDNGKVVDCNDRRSKILNSLKSQSVKIRAELALSQEASELMQVNVHNVLTIDDDKRFNQNLRDFEIGPNPVGQTPMGPKEIENAKKVIQGERAKVEKDYKKMLTEKPVKDSPELARAWKSRVLMERIDKRKEEHQLQYRHLIYEESPLFAVIDKPDHYEKGNAPIWTDKQISEAFIKLSNNAKKTENIVKSSIDKGKLEFSRAKGEALGLWLKSLVPGTNDSNDLLYYMGMKNQVEEVLREDPSMCAAATTMSNRLSSKEMQNMGVVFVSSFVGGAITKEVSKGVAAVFSIGRALSGAEAADLTGLAIGSTFLGDSFRQYNTSVTETTLGLRDASSIEAAKTNVAFNLVFAPTLGPAGWSLGKTLYSSLEKRMAQDLPELSQLIKKASTSQAVRDEIVDKWMIAKVKTAIKNKIIDGEDEALLKSEAGAKILDLLAADIHKNNPNFFKDPNNFDYFLKTAATTLKKRPGDPSDLGDKARQLFLSFNTDVFQSWNPMARQGLMKVFNEGVEELRTVYAKDPVAYAKFSTDPDAQEKIILAALKRAGVVDDAEANAMKTCALKK